MALVGFVSLLVLGLLIFAIGVVGLYLVYVLSTKLRWGMDVLFFLALTVIGAIVFTSGLYYPPIQ